MAGRGRLFYAEPACSRKSCASDRTRPHVSNTHQRRLPTIAAAARARPRGARDPRAAPAVARTLARTFSTEGGGGALKSRIQRVWVWLLPEVPHVLLQRRCASEWLHPQRARCRCCYGACCCRCCATVTTTRVCALTRPSRSIAVPRAAAPRVAAAAAQQQPAPARPRGCALARGTRTRAPRRTRPPAAASAAQVARAVRGRAGWREHHSPSAAAERPRLLP